MNVLTLISSARADVKAECYVAKSGLVGFLDPLMVVL